MMSPLSANPFDNQQFREELTELLDKKLQPISKLVYEHERALQRGQGMFAVFAFIWTSLVASLEFYFHRH